MTALSRQFDSLQLTLWGPQLLWGDVWVTDTQVNNQHKCMQQSVVVSRLDSIRSRLKLDEYANPCICLNLWNGNGAFISCFIPLYYQLQSKFAAVRTEEELMATIESLSFEEKRQLGLPDMQPVVMTRTELRQAVGALKQ